MIKKGAIVLCFLLSVTNIHADSKTMSVTIKRAQVRTSSSFLGKVLYTLEYTDQVEVLDSRAGWYQVKSNKHNSAGWLHGSALTSKRLILNKNASDIDMKASGSEVALAGKGFNSQVEESYKTKNSVDYTWIDKMEEIEISTDDLLVFIQERNL